MIEFRSNGSTYASSTLNVTAQPREEEEEEEEEESEFDDDDGDEMPVVKDDESELRVALRQKKDQLKRMGIMLEALAPLPGVSAEKILNVLENEGPADVRDQKIVQLARKARNLSVALQRERDEVRRLREALKEKPPPPVAPPPKKDNPKREQQLGKMVGELRAQLRSARDEAAQLKRALVKEVGEVPNQEGWRGRAQQIVMLKARVKELEKGRRPPDVDDRARADLYDMERERQRAVEDLTERHATMAADLDEARRKVDAGKARIESLSTECARAKDQVKILLDKTQGDDDLIDALRVEIAALQDQLRRAHRHPDGPPRVLAGNKNRRSP